jgi:predicted MFS family arabinose efflux permease
MGVTVQTGLRRVFLCFASAYLLSYAFRSINAVIAPALVEDLQLSSADLGFLSSAYLLAFAAMQLPLGIWLDKYGARRTETLLLLVAAGGALVFALSDSLAGLWLGRALIGVGVSACLMAPFTAYRQWYPPEKLSQLASWMLVAGTGGALCATVPVAAAIPLIGWRGVFGLMAALILCTAAAIFFVIGRMERNAGPDQSAPAASDRATPGRATPDGGGYRAIFRDPYFRRIALVGTVHQGAFIALQTLWAGPWMITVLGTSKTETSRILFAFNLCLMVAFLALSWWAPRRIAYTAGANGWRVEKVIAVGLVGSVATQALMLASNAAHMWLLWLVLALFATVTTLSQAQVSISFPPSLAGRANTAYNLLLFIGAFVVQWGIGLLIDWFAGAGLSPADAMRAAIGVAVLVQMIALAGFVFNRATSLGR